MKRVLLMISLLAAVAYAGLGNPGAVIRVVSPGHTEYTVRPGDTLAEIAARYGVGVDDLVALNRDRYPSLAERPDLIRVGWVLRVPAGREPLGDILERVDAFVREATEFEPTPTPLPPLMPLKPPGKIPADAEEMRAVAREIFELTNRERVSRGLHPLTWDEELGEIARWRAQDMADRNYFSHKDPVTGQTLVHARCPCGENIAMANTRSAKVFVELWMNSPGHRKNILHPAYRYFGAGVARRGIPYIAVQVFR